MCGINGIILSDANDTMACKAILMMNNEIVHRGPDSSGTYTYSETGRVIGLGMRRLAIIDLNSGDQPIYNDDKSLVIIFNGEIYNFKDLKKQLTLEGVSFKTNTDTEVVLKGYELYGTQFINSLNGMFAFAIHDVKKKKIIVARDRVGEKPLYYCSKDNFFCFASELKSIKKVFQDLLRTQLEISKDAVREFFALTYIPAPLTIYRNVFKLEPGKVIEVDLQKMSVKQINYWNFPPENIISDFSSTIANASARLKELLFDSVRIRMIADVPLGAFLSGGVDSSIICAIMANLDTSKKIETFSIGYANKTFDESHKAELVSKHISSNHNKIILKPSDFQESVDLILNNFDEPFADSSALPTYYVSKIARQHVKVVLTGDGGDEVFGGYNRYLMGKYSSKYKQVVPISIHSKIVKPLASLIHDRRDVRGKLYRLKRFLNSIQKDESIELLNMLKLGFLDGEVNEIFDVGYRSKMYNEYLLNRLQGLQNYTSINRARFIDFKTSLEGDMLVKVDRMTMLASLESRAPFLDPRLIDFSFSIPQEYLIKGVNKKFLLKETFKDMLPNGLFDLTKAGFGVPVGDWLREEYRENLISYINKDFIEEQGIFNYTNVSKIVNEHLLAHNDQTFKVWSFYCFQKWWKNNF